MNTYGYVGGNALPLIDPTGEFAIALPAFCTGGGCAAAAGALINTIGVAILSLLPDNDISDNAPPVNWPKKKPGKYICSCRAQGINCEGQRAYRYWKYN